MSWQQHWETLQALAASFALWVVGVILLSYMLSVKRRSIIGSLFLGFCTLLICIVYGIVWCRHVPDHTMAFANNDQKLTATFKEGQTMGRDEYDKLVFNNRLISFGERHFTVNMHYASIQKSGEIVSIAYEIRIVIQANPSEKYLQWLAETPQTWLEDENRYETDEEKTAAFVRQYLYDYQRNHPEVMQGFTNPDDDVQTSNLATMVGDEVRNHLKQLGLSQELGITARFSRL